METNGSLLSKKKRIPKLIDCSELLTKFHEKSVGKWHGKLTNSRTCSVVNCREKKHEIDFDVIYAGHGSSETSIKKKTML